jgi:hypothetical protein
MIYCRRDPVDTCLSCYGKLFTGQQPFAYDLAELGRHYLASEALMDHWRGVIPADRLTELRYEAVVDDLEGQARRLTDFIGLEWNDACLSFHKTRRPVLTASVNQVRQPLYGDSIGRWRRYAPHLGPLLTVLGLSNETG